MGSGHRGLLDQEDKQDKMELFLIPNQGFSTVCAAMTLGEITACKESTVMVPVVCLCSDKSVDLWI